MGGLEAGWIAADGSDVGWREVKEGEGAWRKMWEEWLGICE